MTLRTLFITIGLLLVSGAFGALAWVAHIPMPWMLGALVGSAIVVGTTQHSLLKSYQFPLWVRSGFISMIGVMIGTQATPTLLTQMTHLPYTLTALLAFIGLAHGGNILIFRHLGGFDRATAFYSGTPGGLMESILLGEASGADIRVLTIQQFLRIIVVVTMVPAGLSLWLGHPVGSAAGALPDTSVAGTDGFNWTELLLVIAAGGIGLTIARVIKLPAGQLIGPLFLTGGLTLTGFVDLHVPFWLIATAQVVVGASLGLRFKGITARLLQRSVWLAVVSVGYMLMLGAAIALVLQQITGLSFLVLLISLAPGGVTEMSIIALSLAASPALVSLHHVLRILLTVLELTFLSRMLGFDRKNETS